MDLPKNNDDDPMTPMSQLTNGLEGTKLSSLKKSLQFSPGGSGIHNKDLSLVKDPAEVHSPLTSKNAVRPSKYKTLLQNGLRVSTPPSRCVRRFTANANVDENSPAFKSPSTYTVVVRQRNILLEDIDANSQDSTFSEPTFRFVEPSGFAPKRTESPRRCLKFSSENLSTDSGISEDGWSDLPTITSSDDESQPLPGLGTLLSASLSTPIRNRKRRSSPPGSAAKRSRGPLSDRASEENRTPSKNKAPEEKKGTLFQYGFTKNKPPLIKASSDSEIIMALNRSVKEELIGDMSRPHALPLLAPGKHVDLKSISSDTLAKLMNGDYDHEVATFKIIDCRYPYEFEGGHIRGAQNLYTCEDIRQELLKTEPHIDVRGKRHILIFHCEFSSERGPFLSRFLRQQDRKSHAYPSLAYPELYLLHGGYSNFFKTHKELCEPQSYRQMEDPAHTSDLRHFKQKSKTWAPGSHRKLAMRSLSRLGF